MPKRKFRYRPSPSPDNQEGELPNAKTDPKSKENKERAFIAASRRDDRPLEKRIKSAEEASRVHKERTGKGFKITPEIVLGKEAYEEDDNGTSWPHARRLSEDNHPIHEKFLEAFPHLDLRYRNPMVHWDVYHGLVSPISSLTTSPGPLPGGPYSTRDTPSSTLSRTVSVSHQFPIPGSESYPPKVHQPPDQHSSAQYWNEERSMGASPPLSDQSYSDQSGGSVSTVSTDSDSVAPGSLGVPGNSWSKFAPVTSAEVSYWPAVNDYKMMYDELAATPALQDRTLQVSPGKPMYAPQTPEPQASQSQIAEALQNKPLQPIVSANFPSIAAKVQPELESPVDGLGSPAYDLHQDVQIADDNEFFNFINL